MHLSRFTFPLLFLIFLTACQGYRPASTIPSADPIATSSPDAVLPLIEEASSGSGNKSGYSVTPLTRILTHEPSSPPTASPSPYPTLTPAATPTIMPTQPITTTLLFTGVIVPARCVQAAIDVNGNPDYPYEEVSEMIRKADLAVGTLNATISDYPPHTGCRPTYVLVGSANNADALARAGFDAMSVATNHIKNCGLTTCGDRAFFDTLENLQKIICKKTNTANG